MKRNQNFRLKQFIKDFSLVLKQFYCIVRSAERIQKVKIKKLKGQANEEQGF